MVHAKLKPDRKTKTRKGTHGNRVTQPIPYRHALEVDHDFGATLVLHVDLVGNGWYILPSIRLKTITTHCITISHMIHSNNLKSKAVRELGYIYISEKISNKQCQHRMVTKQENHCSVLNQFINSPHVL